MSRIFSFLTAALFVSALLPLGCGDETPSEEPDAGVIRGELNCVDGIDDDEDGLIDCDDEDCWVDVACKPPEPPPCGTQKDCGDVVDEIVVPVCVDQKCVAPGSHDRRTGKAEMVPVTMTFSFKGHIGILTNKPRSGLARLVYPFTTDGKPVTCKDLEELSGATPPERSKLDENPDLNFAYRHLIPLEWASGDTTFQFPVTVPRGKFIVYGEAWFGKRELNLPTGSRAAFYCKEDVDLESIDENGTIDLVFIIN